MATYQNEQSKVLFLSAYGEKINFLDALERNITAYKGKWYNQPKWRPADHPRLEDANELQTLIDNARGDTESLIKNLIDDIEDYLNEAGFSNAKLSPLRLSLKSTLKKFQKTDRLSVLDGNLQLVQGYDPEEDATLEEDDTASHELHEVGERVTQLEQELAAARRELAVRAAPLAQDLAAAPREAEGRAAQLEQELAVARREADERAAQLEQDLAAVRLEVVSKNAEIAAIQVERENLQRELAELTEELDNANLQLTAEKVALETRIGVIEEELASTEGELEQVKEQLNLSRERHTRAREQLAEHTTMIQAQHSLLQRLAQTIIRKFVGYGKEVLVIFNSNIAVRTKKPSLIADIQEVINDAERELPSVPEVLLPPRDDSPVRQKRSSSEPPTPIAPDVPKHEEERPAATQESIAADRESANKKLKDTLTKFRFKVWGGEVADKSFNDSLDDSVEVTPVRRLAVTPAKQRAPSSFFPSGTAASPRSSASPEKTMVQIMAEAVPFLDTKMEIADGTSGSWSP